MKSLDGYLDYLCQQKFWGEVLIKFKDGKPTFITQNRTFNIEDVQTLIRKNQQGHESKEDDRVTRRPIKILSQV